ncbi:hypothetical protein AB4037_23585 [Labrys sp. KB_33_2]
MVDLQIDHLGNAADEEGKVVDLAPSIDGAVEIDPPVPCQTGKTDAC